MSGIITRYVDGIASAVGLIVVGPALFSHVTLSAYLDILNDLELLGNSAI
jgi:hypothetical protein